MRFGGKLNLGFASHVEFMESWEISWFQWLSINIPIQKSVFHTHTATPPISNFTELNKVECVALVTYNQIKPPLHGIYSV